MQIEQLAYLAVQSISDVVSFSLWKWKHQKKKTKKLENDFPNRNWRR